jgi:DNA-binding IclR family transcriptional regulator
MLATDVEQMSSFLHEVRSSGRSSSVFAVFLALSAFVERDTGVLTCSQRQLARTAGVNSADAHRALDRLVELGVLIREGRGKYRVHPSVMWRGELARRGQAEEAAPKLTLVDGGKSD